MNSNRLEAFTDGVLAVALTIMVLELKTPAEGSLIALLHSGPILIAYVLSFINIGVYWNNHHHLLQATEKVDGNVLWANLFLLFWLCLVPFVIRWQNASNFEPGAVAAYGIVLGMAAIGYELLERAIIAHNGPSSAVARAVGRDWKGTISITLYVIAVPLAYVSRWGAVALYVIVMLVWLKPDQRMVQVLEEQLE